MALEWDLTKIENHEELWEPCEYDKKDMTGTYREEEDGSHTKLSAVTNALIWNSLSIGLGSITEKNLEKYIERTMMSQSVCGSMLRRKATKEEAGNGIAWYVTPEDIKRHIGLSTNVGDATLAKFRTKMFRIVEANGRKLQKQLEEKGQPEEQDDEVCTG